MLPQRKLSPQWTLIFNLTWLFLFSASVYFMSHRIPKYFIFTSSSYGDDYWSKRPWVFLHVTCGLIATLLALYQLFPFYKKPIKQHRLIGRNYLMSIVISSITAFYLAWHSHLDTLATKGLTVLSLLWLTTAGLGYVAIRRGKVNSHQKWLIKNVTLTFSFSLLPLIQKVATLCAPQAETIIFNYLCWLAWLVPILIVELIRYTKNLIVK